MHGATMKIRRLKPASGLWKIQPNWFVKPGKQTDLKSLVAYSSVAYISMVIGGITTLSYWGVCRYFALIVAHELCSSGFFCVSNIPFERFGAGCWDDNPWVYIGKVWRRIQGELGVNFVKISVFFGYFSCVFLFLMRVIHISMNPSYIWPRSWRDFMPSLSKLM